MRPNARQGSYITARGEGAEYSTLTQASVISLNALPETMTNPIFCFMSQEIPDEKQDSLFPTYSLTWPQGVSAATSQRVSIHPFYGDTFDSGVFEGSRSQRESRADLTRGYNSVVPR